MDLSFNQPELLLFFLFELNRKHPRKTTKESSLERENDEEEEEDERETYPSDFSLILLNFVGGVCVFFFSGFCRGKGERTRERRR